MDRVAPDAIEGEYDLLLVGTGFGSLFFLSGYLDRRPNARVLVLEWGSYLDADWQLRNQANSDVDAATTFITQPGEKPWSYTIAFGGGTNCWWAQTPRLSPRDMRLRTLYGVGQDWPISYDDLEPYYCDAETIMQVAGPNELSVYSPMSRPYPQPAHNTTSVDKRLAEAMPDKHFALPNARLRLPRDGRSACCNTQRCNLCPVEAKFTALNSLLQLFERPNVSLCVNARVRQVVTEGGVATGVMFEHGGREHQAKGELIALGANGIQTPFILLQSGFAHPALGRYLHEKHIVTAEVYLDGLDHFDGGTPMTGFNVSLLDGEDRGHAAGAAIFMANYMRDGLRAEYGRWRQTLPVEFMIEDLPNPDYGVFDEGGDRPVIRHGARSDYCMRGVDRAFDKLPAILASLPVERIERRWDVPTGPHIQGSCRMGLDAESSIVDPDLVHHEVRNLLILGTAVLPSCGPVNPSLTAAALSLRAAARLTS